MLGVVAASDVDAHVRQLLDQRSARSARFSSYSDPDWHSPTSLASPHPLLDDPSSSILDLDEDSRSSMADPTASYDTNDSEDDTSRMSYLGPKMRFHSKAPWELDSDTLDEVDETESTGHGSFIGMFTASRTKAHKPESLSSPRPSTNLGRPSVESGRSLLGSKRSFDTTASARGNLYALAQESLSTSSLGRSHQSARQEGLRGKFHLGRLRSQSTNVDKPSSPNNSLIRLPSDPHPSVAPSSPRASCETTSSTLDVQAGLNALSIDRRCKGGVHPYANPDLVISYATQSPPPPPKSPIHYSAPLRKDSNNTIIETSTATVKSLTKSAPIPEAPAILKRRISHIQGRDISSPVSLLSPECSPIRPQFDEPVPPLPVGANAIPGWTDRNINPGFSLISLEEARAQRMRTPTVHPTQSSDSASSGESTATTSFNNSTQETSTTFTSGPFDVNRSDFAAARARSRSISAGTKAKNALSSFVKQPERRGSENGLVAGHTSAKDSTAGVAGKSLKHKKSGFMRLFGNGKGSDKDAPPVPQPPSVPPLPQSSENTFTPRHNPKLSSHRIPVPSLSPSLLEAIAQQETGQGTSDLSSDSQGSISRRTIPPPLTISTGSSPSQTSAGPFTGSFYSSNNFDIPQSAPANVSSFPALKLRPVSTLFSSHFGDHLDVTKFVFNEEPESIGPKDIPGDTKGQKTGQGNERPRQDSLASGSASSGPSSSTPSFMDSQYNLSPIAPSYTGTALTTPTTGGLMSPTSTTGPTPWAREREYSLPVVGGRYSVDHQSAPPSSTNMNPNLNASFVVKDGEATTTIKVLQEHLDNTNKMWQKRVWDLENELRALKRELGEMKIESDKKSHCEACGAVNGIPPVPPLRTKTSQRQMSKSEGSDTSAGASGVINRPRARTGGASRFVNGQL